ncbi:MAG: YbhN family protein [Halanaeroarchaeum sp.]
MDGLNRRGLALGFVGAGALIAALLLLVDVERVGATLVQADPGLVGVVLGLALLWLLAWSGSLKTVLASMDVQLSTSTSFFVYAAAVFANNVTPFGQAGGEPVTALIVSKVSETRYETGLVAIASVDVLNVVSSAAVVFFGIGVYTTRFTLGSSIMAAVGSVVVILIGIVITFGLGWRYRHGLVDTVSGPIARGLDRMTIGPLASRRITEAGVAERMNRFFGNVEVIAEDRQRLAVALALSLLGWLLQAATLVAAFAALGYDLSTVVTLFVIPLAYLAGITPLPGGLGGIEATFVALLVPTTGTGAAVVTASVILFRVATYWMPVAIGGTSAATFGVRVLS